MADQVVKSILVKTKVEDAYKLWADLTNFPLEQDLKNFKAYAEGMHERTQTRVR
ncbi:MAG: hypothetical protein HZB51_21875 [Chloroflexi bacterium]|nr:hypothetical protein [Chloroflexota bacterium]